MRRSVSEECANDTDLFGVNLHRANRTWRTSLINGAEGGLDVLWKTRKRHARSLLCKWRARYIPRSPNDKLYVALFAVVCIPDGLEFRHELHFYTARAIVQMYIASQLPVSNKN